MQSLQIVWLQPQTLTGADKIHFVFGRHAAWLPRRSSTSELVKQEKVNMKFFRIVQTACFRLQLNVLTNCLLAIGLPSNRTVDQSRCDAHIAIRTKWYGWSLENRTERTDLIEPP